MPWFLALLALAVLAESSSSSSSSSPPLARSWGSWIAWFDSFATGLPGWFLAALAYKESRLNPRNQTGSYRGLLQVGTENLADYLKSTKRSLTAADLFDPAINVVVGSFTLKRAAAAIREQTGTGFESPLFVELLIQGWNSGYSRKAGVARALAELRRRGEPLTADSVRRLAATAWGVEHLTGHLRNDAKAVWQAATARLAERLRNG